MRIKWRAPLTPCCSPFRHHEGGTQCTSVVIPRPCKTTGDPSLSSMLDEVLHVIGAEVATDGNAPNTATAPVHQLATRHESLKVARITRPIVEIYVFEKRVPMNRLHSTAFRVTAAFSSVWPCTWVQLARKVPESDPPCLCCSHTLRCCKRQLACLELCKRARSCW
jgi:hypothetical protein